MSTLRDKISGLATGMQSSTETPQPHPLATEALTASVSETNTDLSPTEDSGTVAKALALASAKAATIKPYTPPEGAYKAGFIKQIPMGKSGIFKPNSHGFYEPTTEAQRKRLAYLEKMNSLYVSKV